MDKDFILQVFKETNDHMRNTERKYLIVTAAYIGLMSVFFSSVTQILYEIEDTSKSDIIRSVSTSGFLLIIGLVVYMLQKWYRAWKQHYLDVCLNITDFHSIDSPDQLMLLPYWLQRKTPHGTLSIDNLLNYVTVLINFVLITVISYSFFYLVGNVVASIISIVLITLYLIFLHLVIRATRRDRFLSA